MNGYRIESDRDGRGWVCVYADNGRIAFGPADLLLCLEWRRLALDLTGIGVRD
jgi:hypothetical protein